MPQSLTRRMRVPLLIHPLSRCHRPERSEEDRVADFVHCGREGDTPAELWRFAFSNL
jgi:hypothetical protein